VGSNPTPRTNNGPTYFTETAINYMVYLRRQGLADTTIKGLTKKLLRLAKNVNLADPDKVTEYIYGLPVSNNYKNTLFLAYYHYLRSKNVPATLIRLSPDYQPIKLPTPEQIKTLIENSRDPLKLKIKLMVHLGLRPIEVVKLTVRDIDFKTNTASIRTKKRGRPRLLKIPEKLSEDLRHYIKKNKLKNRLFYCSTKTFYGSFLRLKQRLAEIYGPEYLNIRLYDLRHYYATMLYIKTRDILFVSQSLGHKSLQHTLKYIHLSKQLEPEKMQYVCKVTDNLEEAKALIEQGFEYVAEFNGKMLFRKPKLP